MTDPDSIDHARSAARQALISTTRRVGDSLPAFSTWLLAGFGVGFSLLVANIDKVTQFIDIRFIRFGLLVFLLSLVIAVAATYLSAIVKASLAAQEDAEVMSKQLIESGRGFDVATFVTEFQRGLLPHIRGLSRRSFEKALAGDSLAGARMIAKISQIQALLVAAQSLLAIVAVASIAFGLKMS